MFLGHHLLEQCASPELAAQIRQSFDKISNLFGNKVQVRWQELAAITSTRFIGPNPLELETFHEISKGICNSREISFLYSKGGRTRAESRCAQPLHISLMNGQWYLLAFDPSKNDMRTFALTRMSKVKITDQTFEKSRMPSVSGLMNGAFGVRYTKAKPEQVKLKVAPDIAFVIRERQWHPSQKITNLKKDFILLEMQLTPCIELANWICSWGPLMEVLEPTSLRQKIANIHRQAAEMYD